MPRPPALVELTRFNLVLPLMYRKKLEALAKKTGSTSLTEVIKKAIDHYEAVIKEVTKEGYTVIYYIRIAGHLHPRPSFIRQEAIQRIRSLPNWQRPLAEIIPVDRDAAREQTRKAFKEFKERHLQQMDRGER